MEEQSPEYLLTKLDNLLAETAPLLEEPRPVHGSDYTARFDEIKKVSSHSYVGWHSFIVLFDIKFSLVLMVSRLSIHTTPSSQARVENALLK